MEQLQDLANAMPGGIASGQIELQLDRLRATLPEASSDGLALLERMVDLTPDELERQKALELIEAERTRRTRGKAPTDKPLKTRQQHGNVGGEEPWAQISTFLPHSLEMARGLLGTDGSFTRGTDERGPVTRRPPRMVIGSSRLVRVRRGLLSPKSP
jgi:hypothetical protein